MLLSVVDAARLVAASMSELRGQILQTIHQVSSYAPHCPDAQPVLMHDARDQVSCSPYTVPKPRGVCVKEG